MTEMSIALLAIATLVGGFSMWADLYSSAHRREEPEPALSFITGFGVVLIFGSVLVSCAGLK